MIDKVKLALRLKTNTFDTEITGLIDACKLDLRLAGVNHILDGDPLVERAVILYCKANFGYDDENGNFQRAYEALRDSLALAGDYADV